MKIEDIVFRSAGAGLAFASALLIVILFGTMAYNTLSLDRTGEFTPTLRAVLHDLTSFPLVPILLGFGMGFLMNRRPTPPREGS